jgi:hypothetical protein
MLTLRLISIGFSGESMRNVGAQEAQKTTRKKTEKLKLDDLHASIFIAIPEVKISAHH